MTKKISSNTVPLAKTKVASIESEAGPSSSTPPPLPSPDSQNSIHEEPLQSTTQQATTTVTTTTTSSSHQSLWRLPSVLSRRRASSIFAEKKGSHGGIAGSISKKWASISVLPPSGIPTATLTSSPSGNAPLSAPTSPSVIATRVRLLSPKMQRSIRINENQVLMLADKAKHDHNYSGFLYKRSSDSNKWQLRWFTLYQNLLFYSENNTSPRPSGVIMLEGCYCERLITTTPGPVKGKDDKQYCFAVTYRRENQRQYDLRAETDNQCRTWIEMIRQASFNKLLLQKEELEQKHLHLLQIVESEKTAKWQYTQQCEELTSEIKKLRGELCALKKEWRVVPSRRLEDLPEDSEEIKKIKKVQSFFRGWLCRRRWKQIVEEYIRSPHAESMRKRNSLVFRMVEAEEEYVEQLNMLISFFLRPFKMAASSKKPPCCHEDVNSIFLNSETLLFLHQIFLKGLSARMESWPTLVLDPCRDSSHSSPRQKKPGTNTAMQLLGNTNLGDLFDMLLPMLSIYQEYVRNHHYSLQVLAECKQSSHFAAFLTRLESRPALQGRTLETFLTYPMHQIPRYIITLHELLAHTPHNHVERKSLDHARMQLEDLSRQMHDEVSETENIRKSLAIERMIVEGCDILLDVNQMFVRQGSLIQILNDQPRSAKTRIAQFKSEKEAVRQCFLFSNHLIVATRTSGGKLHLVPTFGKVSLQEATLIEDPNEVGGVEEDGVASQCSMSMDSTSSDNSSPASEDPGQKQTPFQREQANLDFKIIVEPKSGPTISLHLVAPTMQEKQAWISDISQCLDNVHFNNLFRASISDTSSVTMPHCIKNDPRLFRDDIDIRFSRTLNSCKVPHIRYATPERLLERLTDLRFLSIDFLNTFLLTYRVFADGVTVLEALKKVFYNPDVPEQTSDSRDSSPERSPEDVSSPPPDLEVGIHSPRRISTISSLSVQATSHMPMPTTQKHQHIRFQDSFQAYPKSKHESSQWQASKVKSPTREASKKKCSRCGHVSPRQSTQQDSLPGMEIDTPRERTWTIETQKGMSGQHWRWSHRKCNYPFTNELVIVESKQNIYPKKRFSTNGTMATIIPIVEEEQRGLDEARSRDERIFSTGGLALSPAAEEDENDTHEQDQELPAITVPLASVLKSADKSKYLSLPDPSGENAAAEGTKSTDDSEVQVEHKRPSISFQGSFDSDVRSQTKDGAEGEKSPDIKQASEERRSRSRKQSGPTSPPRSFGGPRRSIPRRMSSLEERPHPWTKVESVTSGSDGEDDQDQSLSSSRRRSSGRTHSSASVYSGTHLFVGSHGRKRRSCESDFGFSSLGGLSSPRSSVHTSTPRSSFQVPDSPQHSVSKMGVVITSARQSQRRSSSASAAAAFAVATAGSSNPRDLPKTPPGGRFSVVSDIRRPSFKERPSRQESIISTAATMRVLNVLRHWVSKHWQDFESDSRLCSLTVDFLEDLICCPTLLPAEHKAASQLLRMITSEEPNSAKPNLDALLAIPSTPSNESIETLSAMDIAEQMTYIDHQIFVSIRSEEFLKTAWTRSDKNEKAPHILMITKRFNEMSRLVVSEVVRHAGIPTRITVIEKWVAVADICRVFHNFNGVLQVCSAFQNSSVFRLKKTWEKVSKTTKQTLDKLQALISSDGRFRSLRDALHRCDPPCIPYLGMYLTDLSFIEEGTPNFTEDGLLNFSKMRMIAHVIREIRHFQQMPYKIEHKPRVCAFLLDESLLLTDDDLYRMSLNIEPRRSTLANISLPITTGSPTLTTTTS